MTSENNPHNPFDQTLWDPIDSEHAIEDPLHGSEAVMGLLSIPPYLNDDGSYYVFGGSYVCGTCTFDSEGKPFIEFKTGFDTTFMHEVHEHQQWVEAFNAGELPPREELGYPVFQFNEQPYFIFKT